MAQPAPIGFEGFEPEGGQKSYAVQFTPSAEKTQLAEEPAVSYGAAASGEEIQLLGKGAAPGLSEAEAEKVATCAHYFVVAGFFSFFILFYFLLYALPQEKLSIS